jgi:hypothetical protein
MAFGRLMSGLAIAAMVAAAPVSAQTVAPAPQPKAEQVSADSEMQGSNRLFGLVVAAIILAVIAILAFEREDGNTSLPPPVSP